MDLTQDNVVVCTTTTNTKDTYSFQEIESGGLPAGSVTVDGDIVWPIVLP